MISALITAPTASTDERAAFGPEPGHAGSRRSPQMSPRKKVKGGWRPLKFFHVDPDDQHYVGYGELVTREKLVGLRLWLDITDADATTAASIKRLAKIRGESVSKCLSSLLLASIADIDSDYYFVELDRYTTRFFDRISYGSGATAEEAFSEYQQETSHGQLHDYGFSFSDFSDYFNRRKQASGRRVHFIKKDAFGDIHSM